MKFDMVEAKIGKNSFWFIKLNEFLKDYNLINAVEWLK